MTPPPVTTVPAIRRPLVPVPWLEPEPQAAVLCPAIPAAIIVPPTVVFLTAVAIVTAAARLMTPGLAGWALARPGVLVTLIFPLVYCVRVVVNTRRDRLSPVLVPVTATVLALFFAWVLPGTPSHPLTLGALVACVVLLPSLAVAWREAWLEHRPVRATLLAADEWAAASAILALEEVPGLTIPSVVLPECDEKVAAKLLRRRVTRRCDGPFAIEKRVIVHCPDRNRLVGSGIAQLVARGHQITSKSRVMRRAEGRVDTTRANPLDLVMGRPSNRMANAASRLLDIVLASVALILLAPVFAAIALAIRLEGRGPLLYVQERVGAGGRLFKMLKFRSMRPDAEAASGPVWARERDPRITRVGRFLRTYRLDELPQFVNVLRGDMALVGPRPERPHFCAALRDEVPLFELRAIVRPGITGWAQVRAPYAAASDEARTKLAFDLFYVTHRSPWFDLAILVETLGVALSGRGAR